MAAKGKLSLKTKLGYGVGDLGGNLFFTLTGFYLLYFLTDSLGLSSALAGTALMIGKIWDAVTDPTVGFLSDRTETRWGRRRPYIFIGGIFLFIFTVVMFSHPRFASQRSLFVWVTVVYCLLCTAYTLVNIPYGALTPELTDDYDERTVLNGYRMSFAVVGTFCGASANLIVSLFPDENTGWLVVGIIMGALMSSTSLIVFFTIKESGTHEKPKKINIFKSYIQVLTCKPYLFALFPWTFHITGVTIIQSALVYYFQYIYHDEGLFIIALVVLLLSCMLFIPIWVKISARWGKKRCYNIGMLIFAAAVMAFFLWGEQGGTTFAFVIMAVAGIGFATQYVMPYSLVPDIVEYDHIHRGVRKEGPFYGLWTLFSKFGSAIAIFLSGWVLELTNYAANAVEQPRSAVLGIKLLCGPVPAVCFVIGVLILSFYPITRKYYDEMMKQKTV